MLIVFLLPVGLGIGIYNTVIGIDKASIKAEQELEATLSKQNLSICQVCKDLETTIDTLTYQKSNNLSDEVFTKVLKKCKNCKEEEMQVLKDSLNKYLEPKELNVCDVIRDYIDLENKVIEEMDKKYPKFNAPDNYYENKLSEAIVKYTNKHKIEKSKFEQIKLFTDDCQEEEFKQRQFATKQLKEARENFRNNCLSGYDGRHRALVDYIKEDLNNPKSFEHVETRYSFKDGYVLIEMKYREQNSFGAIVTETIKAEVSLIDCSEIIKVYQ